MVMNADNVKGFIFTVDAIFAMVVAAAAVSILLYIHFTPQISYQEPASEAYSVMQTLLSTTVAQAAAGSTYANYSYVAGNSSQYTWPMFGHDAADSGATPGYGPQFPRLLWDFGTKDDIVPGISVADGVVAFVEVTGTAGSRLFILNATTGKVIANTTVGNNFIVSPMIYNHEIGTANSGDFFNFYSENGTNIGEVQAQDISLNSTGSAFNNYFQISKDLVSSSNFTEQLSGTIGSYLAYGNGAYIASNQPTTGGSPGTISSFGLFSQGTAREWMQGWTRNLGSVLNTTPPSISGNYVGVGWGSNLSVYSLNGSRVVALTFPTRLSGGPALANGSAYAITGNALYSINITSNSITYASNILTPTASTGSSLFERMPAITPNIVYVLANGQLFEAFNRWTGQRLWAAPLNGTPFKRIGDVAISGGNAYISDGTTLFAFGGCSSSPQESLLQAIATMYVNGEGGCANLLLNSTYGTGNIGIFINGTYGPAYKLANFSSLQGSQFISFQAINLPTSSPISAAAWVYPYSVQDVASDNGNFVGVLSYGTKSTGCTPGGNSFVFAITSLFRPSFSDYCNNAVETNGPTLSPNAWNFIGISASGSNIIFYVNNQSESMTVKNTITPVSKFLTIGDVDNGGPGGRVFNGIIAGVQLYGNVLTANQMTQLYNEGLGGMPIQNNSLAGWWPLEGDGSDYSGNGNGNFGIARYPLNYVSSNYMPPSLKSAFEVSAASVPMLLNVNGTYNTYNVSVVVWRK
jgi:hypothetical protein